MTVTAKGYIRVKRKRHPLVTTRSGKIYLHRLVMSEVLGRPLTPRETVHHRDENKGNNLPENLYVTTGSSHSRLHVGQFDRDARGRFRRKRRA